eukprot:1153393-Pleurochrysis_carterae.AAC.3
MPALHSSPRQSPPLHLSSPLRHIDAHSAQASLKVLVSPTLKGIAPPTALQWPFATSFKELCKPMRYCFPVRIDGANLEIPALRYQSRRRLGRVSKSVVVYTGHSLASSCTQGTPSVCLTAAAELSRQSLCSTASHLCRSSTSGGHHTRALIACNIMRDACSSY